MMLREAPRHFARVAAGRMRAWWNPRRSHQRLRRRLLVFSAPVLVLLLAAAGAAAHIARVGDATQEAFARQDVDALRANVEQLRGYGVIDDAVVTFAEGDVLVLDGLLADADARFTDALAQIEDAEACPVRVNLELVRETLGDIAVTSGRLDDANTLYRNAITVITDAAAGCFDGNADPNEERRALRADAKARLERKLAVINAPPPPPPTAAPPVADQPPPPPGAQGGEPQGPPPGLPPIAQREPGQGPGTAPLPPLLGENLPSPPQLMPVPGPAPGPGEPPPTPPPLGSGVADPNAPQAIRIMGEVGPDGIPIGDPNTAGPPLTLGPVDGEGQLGLLERLLEDANSYSGDRE
ncbi:hypothetical protein [Mycobacterium sp. 236(2023)]|uniref:hypothetical protein n=1 Tax=Mycobacterium sp. 236(2023) TaxID=3038163 RepID=UPI0024151113|nr:hypothetical protein [Mycobacterium sp. 236(2023)]MDG4669369.1 hypothetical protein [Mycobacterium sp. 236(2023)]